VLPYLEWGIDWRVIATRTEYLQLHAATLPCDGQAVVFAGPSGTGKSTLAAGLLARGWSYLSDEFALIDTDTLHVHSLPKALCIKAGSFSAVEHLNLPLWRRRHYVKAFKGRVAYVKIQNLAHQVDVSPRPVRFVVFPRYAEGSKARLYPVSRARAAFSLTGYAFNRNAFGSRTITILSEVVRNAECFGLQFGPLDETCDLVESLFLGK
jgi:HprK-related kinase A